jgi:tripartite-type tricarboxylate transporter receptor subunit TctC
MKKIIAILTSLLVMTCAMAKQEVEIAWWAGISSGPINYVRAVIDEANRNQNKYVFVIVAKPGAGGAIAAQYTLVNKKLTILGTGDAFFVRPNFFPNEKLYHVEDFKLITPLATLPFAVIKNKNKSMEELEKQKQIVIGVGGLGTQQHLIAEQIKLKHPNLVIVPYSAHTDATREVLGGFVDMSTDFLVGVAQYPQLDVVGITGRTKIDNYETLSSKGYLGLEKYNINIFLVAPSSMPVNTYDEIHNILADAQTNNVRLEEMYKRDFASKIVLSKSDYPKWINDRQQEFKVKTKNIKLD